MKALEGAFDQEKALVGAFSVIVKTDCETDGGLHSSIVTLSSLQLQRIKSSRVAVQVAGSSREEQVADGGRWSAQTSAQQGQVS